MDRRQLLGTAGAAIPAVVAGCTDLVTGPGTTGDGSEDGRPAYDPGSDRADPQSLFVENLDDESRRVTVDVTHRADDSVLFAGTYEIPDERGIEFRRTVAWGDRFDVSIDVSSSVSETFEWHVGSCPGPTEGAGTSESPGGSRNGSVRIHDDVAELTFLVDACDAVHGNEVSIGPAAGFEVEESG